MFDELKIRKHSMGVYNKMILPDAKGCRSIFQREVPNNDRAKWHIGSVLRVAACMVLILTLAGVIVFQNAGGFSTKTTPMQNGTSAQGTTTKDSFTLVAYAASPSSEDNGVIPAIKNIDQSTSTTLQPNVNITLPAGKVYKIMAGSDAGEKTPYFSSGFQFSGDNIASITMTTQKASLTADDPSKVGPLLQKELRWYCDQAKANPQLMQEVIKTQNTDILPKYQMTPAEQELWNSYMKMGTTITFPPSGFTAWWDTGFSKENISDTINITIKFNDGTTQNKTVTIGESDSGDLTVTLSN